jgi:hypothetical protein
MPAQILSRAAKGVLSQVEGCQTAKDPMPLNAAVVAALADATLRSRSAISASTSPRTQSRRRRRLARIRRPRPTSGGPLLWRSLTPTSVHHRLRLLAFPMRARPATRHCLPSAERRRRPGNEYFRGSMAGPCAPLSTLRCCPRGQLRMTRGRCGSLLLHRDGLAPSTPCRSPGALRITLHSHVNADMQVRSVSTIRRHCPFRVLRKGA